MICSSDSVWYVQSGRVVDDNVNRFVNGQEIIKASQPHLNSLTMENTHMQTHAYVLYSASLTSSSTSLHLILSGVSKASFRLFLMDVFQTEFSHMLGGRESC